MPSRMYDTHSTATVAMTALVICELLLKKYHDDSLLEGFPATKILLNKLKLGELAELNDLHPTPDQNKAVKDLLMDILQRVIEPSAPPSS